MLHVKKIDENVIYIVNKKLGNGKYGQVFMGFDQKIKSPVAVKIISLEKIKNDRNPELLKEKLKRQIVNMQIAKNQQTPHIVKFYQAKQSPRNLYMICELCNGFDFNKLLKIKGYLTQREAIEYFKEILEGFKHLNSKHIVHRDIKPANLLLDNYSIKIADLGLSKQIEGPEEMLESTVGSPYYMSPQIFSSEKYTEKTDIWSLGVILYEMIYGKVPWSVNSIVELKQKIKNYVITFPKIPFVTDQTKQLISQMLQSQEKNRIQWSQLFNYYESSIYNNDKMINEDEEQNYSKILEQTLQYFNDSLYIESYLQIYKIVKKLKITTAEELLKYEHVYKSSEEFLQKLKEFDANQEKIFEYFQHFLRKRNQIAYLFEVYNLLHQLITEKDLTIQIKAAIICSKFLILKYAFSMLFIDFKKIKSQIQSIQKLELPFEKYLRLLFQSDAEKIEKILGSFYKKFMQYLESLKIENYPIFHELQKNIGGLLNCERGDERLLQFLLQNFFRQIFNSLKHVQIKYKNDNSNEIINEGLLVRMLFEYLNKSKSLFGLLNVDKKNEEPKKLSKNVLQCLWDWKTNLNDKFYENLNEIPALKLENVNVFISKQFKWSPINFNGMIL